MGKQNSVLELKFISENFFAEMREGEAKMKMLIVNGWGLSIRPYNEGENINPKNYFVVDDLPEHLCFEGLRDISVPGVGETLLGDFSKDDCLRLVALFWLRSPWERVKHLSGEEALEARDSFWRRKFEELTQGRYEDYPDGLNALDAFIKLDRSRSDNKFDVARTTKKEYLSLCDEFCGQDILLHAAETLAAAIREENSPGWEDENQ